MGLQDVTRRARLARARRQFGRESKRRLAGSPRLLGKSKTYSQAVIDLLLRPVVWLQQGFLELMRWIDRMSARKVRVKIPWDPDRPFLVVGHRGSPHREVENTIPSFEAAIEHDGANAVEIDLCITKDDVLVSFHDWDPDEFVAFARQQAAEPAQTYRPLVPPKDDPMRRPVPTLTLKELRDHYGFCKMRSKRPLKVEIPTFDEFCKWAARKPRLRAIYLDMKVPRDGEAFVPKVIQGVRSAISRHGVKTRIIVLSPEANIQAAFAKEAPEFDHALDIALPAGVVTNIEKRSAFLPAKNASNACASLGRPPMTFGGWKAFRRIVELDMETWKAAPGPVRDYTCWTINHRREIGQLLEIGVHAILTDHPKLLSHLATRKKRPL